MSNPTSNFGWVMPTSTDLVTDLPADFEVFGQAVDTSLAELKGGTTGQILSKASNTSMDFTWITNDVGDITEVVAGTGITGGGTSGAVTVSFDQANYGGGQFAAGKNKVINGDFGIWQRGTSFSNTTQYTADRWYANSLYTGDTITQQTFTPGTAPVAGYEGTFYARFVTSASAGTRFFQQRIEDVRTFAGQTVTFSFWAKASAGTTMVSSIGGQNFGSGGSSFVNPTNQTNTLTTSWQRFTQTAAVPSIAGKTIGTSSYLEASFTISTVSTTFEIWGVQLEAGSTATPFQTATGTKQGELAVCQRYYQKSYAQGTAVPTNAQFIGTVVGPSITTTNNACFGYVKFATPMRTAPTVTNYSYTSSTAAALSNAAGTDQAASSAVASGIGDSGYGIYNNSGGTITTTNGWIVHYAASSEL